MIKAGKKPLPRTKQYVVTLTAEQARARSQMPTGMRQGFDVGVSRILKTEVERWINAIPKITKEVKLVTNTHHSFTESGKQLN